MGRGGAGRSACNAVQCTSGREEISGAWTNVCLGFAHGKMVVCCLKRASRRVYIERWILASGTGRSGTLREGEVMEAMA